MKNTVSLILQEIQGKRKEPLLIALDGRCASGKTTLALRLAEEINCNVIHMDHFFLRPEQRTKNRLSQPGGNVDYERFAEEVMKPLRQGQAFSYRVFDCKTMGFTDSIQVKPKAVTIVEGTYSCHPALWDYYDIRIFLSVDPKEQIRRIAGRNGEKAAATFRERWIPLEEQYFSAFDINGRCDYEFTMLTE
ncbi:MAG: uridine kinase [Ruminococcus sp.]